MKRRGWLIIPIFLLLFSYCAEAQNGPTVTSVSLSPSHISGGSGATSIGTVMLSAGAPSGGTSVSLSSSLSALAAVTPSVTVPAGQARATFTVWTNPKYRDYSGLAFSPVISASANGSTQSATLSVSAPPTPADIQNDTADRSGDVCGGAFPATFGEKGILYTCFAGPTPGTAGHCTFKEECLVSGCEPAAANGFQFGDRCGTGTPYPISDAPSVAVGASNATGTATSYFVAPSGGNTATIDDPLYCVTAPYDTTIPQGRTSASFPISNTDTTVAHFVDLGITISSNSGPAAQLGLSWYAVLPSGSCKPATCASLGYNCGIWPDGCCGYIDCGTCSAPDICGGGNVLGECGCTPNNECAVQGWTCGTASDGCGGSLNCGSCPNGQYCDLYHWCTSCPSSCVMLGFGCGSATDPCTGNKLNCGNCPNGEPCIDDVCCVPQQTCVNNSLNCGTVSDGCGGTLNCGTCPSGETCTNNVCTGGCTPVTCAYLGMNCGTTPDGCGGTLNCGTCPGGETCTNNVCTSGCTPVTCSYLGLNCGTAPNGCGGTLNCGSCKKGKTCVSNVCR